jgi:hypothetical protein
MRAPKSTGGAGNKSEELDGMCCPVTITGGDPLTRRVLRDYSKTRHAAEDKLKVELDDILRGKVDENVSSPVVSTVLGGKL